jgi:hypothetical protein
MDGWMVEIEKIECSSFVGLCRIGGVIECDMTGI